MTKALSWAVAVIVLAFAAFPRSASAATFDEASATCQAVLTGPTWYNAYGHYKTPDGKDGFRNPQCQLSHLGQAKFEIVSENWLNSGGALSYYGSWAFSGGIPDSYYCNAGDIVPAGTHYTQSSATGQACTSGGAHSCAMALAVGGANSGKQMLTGEACPAEGLPDLGALPEPATETTNADGSKTFCDPISGKCVTSGIPAADVPASSSSSANASTDTTSHTDTPASSSSTTTVTETTTTTTGDGSGSGSGNSTGVSSGVSTSHTDAPASSSSTASKCTTGVCDVGNADGNVGELYTASTDSPASLYADFKASVASAPVVGAASGFFDASSIAGTCPTWHIPGNKFWGEAGFSFDFFCSSGMLALLALAGWLVLAVGAWRAFTIALY